MALQFVCDFYFSILSQQPVNSSVLKKKKKTWDNNENIDFWMMVFRAFKFICQEKDHTAYYTDDSEVVGILIDCVQ